MPDTSAIRTFLTSHPKPVLVILGATASGKSDLAVDLALELDGEIINADSRQVYRGLDILSAKITPAEMRGIPHHLIDIRDPDQTLSTSEWQSLALAKISEIQKRGKLPIVCGGTMLYLDALVQHFDFGGYGTDPALRERLSALTCEEILTELSEAHIKLPANINPKNHRHLVRSAEVLLLGGKKSTRPSPYQFYLLGITRPREVLLERINRRAELMVERGGLVETKNLLKKYPNLDLPSLSSIGYRELAQYLKGEITLPKAIELLQIHTRQYARRQMTWWKRNDEIHWLEL